VVNADNLLVDAHTTTNNIVLGLAGGLPVGGEAAKFAVSGAVTVVSMNNHTLARIDDGAFVDADGTVDVKAVDNVLNVNIVGGIVQGRSLGFGITAGINLIDRDTKAIIGNQESVLGRGEYRPTRASTMWTTPLTSGTPMGSQPAMRLSTATGAERASAGSRMVKPTT